MDRLVPVISQLQQVLNALDSRHANIYLPQLVVVGSQSSGKSSVLENIVGRDFLPRGSNIVTRRPLILTLHMLQKDKRPAQPPTPQLDMTSATAQQERPTTPSLSNPPSNPQNNDKGQDLPQEYGVFGHLPNHKFFNFNEIKQEIINETDRLAAGQSISSEPIYLHIYSPHTPPLTLVDLPGITHVATGNQPEDIEQQIKSLVLQYISNPNSIIVAVSSATEDISNSTALQIARQVDPENKRTLGVLTKIDLMDQGTDAMRILQNRAIPLELGYVGVINRSQKDINEGKLIRDSLQSEREYFSKSAVYSAIAAFSGTEYLTKRLSALLFQRLRQHLPHIKQQIIQTILETERELEGYGRPLIEKVVESTGLAHLYQNGGDMGKEFNIAENITLLGPILLELLSRYASSFISALDGSSMSNLTTTELTTAELHGGARIAFVFHSLFGKELDEIDPFQVLTDYEIRTAMRNATGPRTSLFLPEIAFELLVKQQIERLRQPALNCIDLVMQELTRVGLQCQINNVPQLQNFPVLKDKILLTLHKLFDHCLAPTKSFVKNLVNIELAYINTSHPNFIGGTAAMQTILQQRRRQAQQNYELALQQNVETTLEQQYKQLVIQEQQQFIDDAQQHQHSTDQSLHNDFDSYMFSTVLAQQQQQQQQQQQNITNNNNNNTVNNIKNRPFGQYTTERLKAGISQPPCERELIEIQVIKTLIQSYFSIVKQTIKDTVPKAIMLMLVNRAKDEVQSELVKDLYKEQQFMELLTETQGIAEQRESCQTLITLMRKALDMIAKINESVV